MSEGQSAPAVIERRPRGARGVTGAIILIALGAALLLSNLGLISVQWYSLWRFWPVFLILVGLDLLLSRSVLGSMLAALLGLVVVAGILFVASDRYAGPAEWSVGAHTVTRDIASHELGDIDSLQVTLQIGAASVEVAALDDGDAIAGGSYTTDRRLTLDETYEKNGSTGTLTLRQRSSEGSEWAGQGMIGEVDLQITDQVPVDMTISAGAGDLTLDLSGVQLSSLRIDGGAGTVQIVLPETGAPDVQINGGVGTFEITVPRQMEASLHVDGLTTIDVGSRFEERGDRAWETAGYADARDRADIHISAGLGTVNVH